MLVDRGVVLARNLRAARLRAGFTLHEVAEACGVFGRGTVSRWESERDPQHPGPEILVKLARLYGVSLDSLYGLEHAPEESPELRAVRLAVHERLIKPQLLAGLSPAERVRRILDVAREAAPDAIPVPRLTKCIGSAGAYEALVSGREIALPMDGLAELAYLVGVPPRVLTEVTK